MKSEARKVYDASAGRPVVLRLRHHLRVLATPQERDPDRPRTRGDCIDGPRPCPWVSCRHHLYLDVNERTGTIKLNQPSLEPEELEHSCALDVADEGGISLKDISDMLSVTRERARQIEEEALGALRAIPELASWKDDDE